jgi:hypothetical protein
MENKTGKVNRGKSVDEASMDEIAGMLSNTLGKISLSLDQHQVLQRGIGRLLDAAKKAEVSKEPIKVETEEKQ